MKFSECVVELTENWILWMKNWNIVKNKSFSVQERKTAAMECERLIDREYVLVDTMDNFFNKK